MASSNAVHFWLKLKVSTGEKSGEKNIPFNAGMPKVILSNLVFLCKLFCFLEAYKTNLKFCSKGRNTFEFVAIFIITNCIIFAFQHFSKDHQLKANFSSYWKDKPLQGMAPPPPPQNKPVNHVCFSLYHCDNNKL